MALYGAESGFAFEPLFGSEGPLPGVGLTCILSIQGESLNTDLFVKKKKNLILAPPGTGIKVHMQTESTAPGLLLPPLVCFPLCHLSPSLNGPCIHCICPPPTTTIITSRIGALGGQGFCLFSSLP